MKKTPTATPVMVHCSSHCFFFFLKIQPQCHTWDRNILLFQRVEPEIIVAVGRHSSIHNSVLPQVGRVTF